MPAELLKPLVLPKKSAPPELLEMTAEPRLPPPRNSLTRPVPKVMLVKLAEMLKPLKPRSLPKRSALKVMPVKHAEMPKPPLPRNECFEP